MQASNCVQFCLNLFCCKLHEVCLPHKKNDLDKTIHNLQLASASIRS